MPVAITLRLDASSASSIERLWQTLADTGVDSHCQNLGYDAHITLAVLRDDAPVDLLAAALVAVAHQRQALPIMLSAIGVFLGPESILWAAPVITHELLACHGMLHAAVVDLPVDPHFLPGVWMPHVSLSGSIADPERGLAVLRPCWQPVTGFLNRADLVRFPPVDVWRTCELAP